MDDDDFSEETQDLKTIQIRQQQKWLGFRRQGKKSMQHDDLDTNGPMSEKEMKAYGSDAQKNDIWKDETCMKLLNERVLSKSTNATEAKQTKEKILTIIGMTRNYTSRIFVS